MALSFNGSSSVASLVIFFSEETVFTRFVSSKHRRYQDTLTWKFGTDKIQMQFTGKYVLVFLFCMRQKVEVRSFSKGSTFESVFSARRHVCFCRH